MNLREVTMKYGHLVVSIRHDSAKIWGFRYVLTLVVSTLKIMASISEFVRAPKHFASGFSGIPSTILT
jgi:hypothetical protein